MSVSVEMRMSPEDKAQKLRYALKRAVGYRPAEALLLSGGVDSGLLAGLDPTIPAITVVLEGQGVDTVNAQKVVEHFGTPWYLVEISQEQALADLPDIIQLSHSYDLGILNDIPIYEGIKYAASRGWRTIRTGDAADTLFAGYSYLQSEGFDIRHYLRSLLPHFTLASSKLGEAMGMHMVYPYLFPEVVELALSLDLSDNVATIATTKPGDFHNRDISETTKGRTWGKIALRNAAYSILPEHLIWRTKTDLEYGSGMYKLEQILEASLTPEAEENLRISGKHFWNKAHGALYLMATSMGIEPVEPKNDEYACTWCAGGIPEGRHHCAACGAYPSNQEVGKVFQNEEN